ncbi:hypothetical protein [Nonomuraea endophytica]|uniref:Uncharacterized protein n=1 Tax=Nonomuraea endophytica TaxID=714136 RepID=A0A7W8EGB2_9ACTN|nr:hypothetical protein [Nonomuraea endophytica]MBB5077382.1 hypothetical protein [Nonomuraea endophytica]
MNPNALETKAQQRGWQVVSEHDGDGPMMTLVRDDWEIWVAFSGSAPETATLRKPGRSEPRKLGLREIGMWVRRDRGQMSRFAVGDQVIVGGRPGTVTDITLARSPGDTPGRIRLTVAYDDGGTGTPFSDQVERPRAGSGRR